MYVCHDIRVFIQPPRFLSFFKQWLNSAIKDTQSLMVTYPPLIKAKWKLFDMEEISLSLRLRQGMINQAGIHVHERPQKLWGVFFVLFFRLLFVPLHIHYF